MFNTTTGYRAIYNQKANVKRGKFYEVWSRSVEDRNTLCIVDRTEHAWKRKILSSAFSDRAVHSAEPFIIKHVNRWCDLLVEDNVQDWSKPKNMAHWADWLVFDIFTELFFGKSFDIKEPEENEWKDIQKLMAGYLSIMYPVRKTTNSSSSLSPY